MKLLNAIKIAEELKSSSSFEIHSYGNNGYDITFEHGGVLKVVDIPLEAEIWAEANKLFIRIPVEIG